MLQINSVHHVQNIIEIGQHSSRNYYSHVNKGAFLTTVWLPYFMVDVYTLRTNWNRNEHSTEQL